MKITIIGGGHVGTLMAAEFARKQHEVTVFTSRPGEWGTTLQVYNPRDELLFESYIHVITNQMETAMEGAQIIWVVIPAFLFTDTARKMLPYVRKGQKIGIVPGSGGAEFAFRPLTEKGCILFGMQRVHSIARLKEYGHSVYMLGRKSALQVAAIPAGKSNELSEEVQELFDIPTQPLPNYLCVTLTPSNPILHTARLYSLFQNYKRGILYPRNYLFYEEWTDESSRIMFACDRELQDICHRLDKLDLRAVESLADYYESDTEEKMTKKIAGIRAFKGIASPMVQVRGGWIPDLGSRYFKSDFPYGLKIIRDIAMLVHADIPHIEKVWSWYRKLAGENEPVFELPVTGLDEFYQLY